MSTAERTADELVDLAKSDRSVSDGLVRFEQIFDAYMIETPGDFVAKRKALLDAFQERRPRANWPPSSSTSSRRPDPRGALSEGRRDGEAPCAAIGRSL